MRLRDDLRGTPRRPPARRRDAGPLGVRGVAEQQVDARVADLGEPPDVGADPVDRRVVDLVVARCGRSGRRASRARSRPRPGSSAPSRTNSSLERARCSTGPPSGSISHQLGRAQQAVLVELRLDQAEREPRRPDSAPPTSRSRYGSAPTWSSWPCVSTTARIVLAALARGTRSRAARGRRRAARRAGRRGRRRRRRCSPSRLVRPSCSCRPRRGRRAG